MTPDIDRLVQDEAWNTLANLARQQQQVIKAAERLMNCLAEFGEQKVAGQCLCSSCSEHLEDLDGALAAYREATK